jgi:hypothetical protein
MIPTSMQHIPSYAPVVSRKYSAGISYHALQKLAPAWAGFAPFTGHSAVSQANLYKLSPLRMVGPDLADSRNTFFRALRGSNTLPFMTIWAAFGKVL